MADTPRQSRSTVHVPPPDHHRDVTGGALRAGVFGAMDGLVSNFSLVAGVIGGGVSTQTVILTGLAGLAAGDHERGHRQAGPFVPGAGRPERHRATEPAPESP